MSTAPLVGSVRSVNVGLPRDVPHKQDVVRTAIFKSPVAGRVRARGNNLEGDEQADPRYHGGPTMAVYAFPTEHYERWKAEFPGIEGVWGSFGENLSTQGLDEHNTCVGDRFRCGTVELVVTKPRQPCSKFAMRLGDPSAVRLMHEWGTTGFYMSIAVEGELEAGDTIERIASDPRSVSVHEVNEMMFGRIADRAVAESALLVEALPQGTKDAISRHLGSGDHATKTDSST